MPISTEHETDIALLTAFPVGQRELVGRYLNGELSAQMTLMYWLQSTPSRNDIQSALRDALGASDTAGLTRQRELLSVLANLADSNESGCDLIAGMLRSGVDHSRPAPNV